jgi:hypothetical protein
MDQTHLTLGQRVIYGFALWLFVAIVLINVSQMLSLAIFVVIGAALAWAFADEATRQKVRGRHVGGHDAGQLLRGAGALMIGWPRATWQFARGVYEVCQRQNAPAPSAPPHSQTPAPDAMQSAPSSPPAPTVNVPAPAAQRPAPQAVSEAPDSDISLPVTGNGREQVGYRADGSTYIF